MAELPTSRSDGKLVMGLRERFSMWCELKLIEKKGGDVDSSIEMSIGVLGLSVQGLRQPNPVSKE